MTWRWRRQLANRLKREPSDDRLVETLGFRRTGSCFREPRRCSMLALREQIVGLLPALAVTGLKVALDFARMVIRPLVAKGLCKRERHLVTSRTSSSLEGRSLIRLTARLSPR